MLRGRIFIPFHGRFPSEKAAALFVAENARSLGVYAPVVVLAPRRRARGGDAHATYHLPKEVAVRYLPTLDLFGVPLLGSIAFRVSDVVFAFSAFFFLLFRAKRHDVVITNEPLPALLATWVVSRVVYEVHDFPVRWKWFFSWLFRRVHTILATNIWKKDALVKAFPFAASRVVMERNGVAVERFRGHDLHACRARLGLPSDKKIVVYTGHLYSWKGADTLLNAAKHMPDVVFYMVGGTFKEVEEFTTQYGKEENVTFVGQVAHEEIPLWQGAADALVLPNTAREKISFHYTSPMKLFEYMASGRPVVASTIPSIEEVLSPAQGFFFAPDNAEDLARTLNEVLRAPEEAQARAHRAQQEVMQYAWDKRAQRLLQRLQSA